MLFLLNKLLTMIKIYDVNFLILLIMAIGGTFSFSASESSLTLRWSSLLRSSISRMASMTSAILMPFGQRALQVKQEAQIQMAFDFKS